MLSYAGQERHPEWIGMIGVLAKRTRIGLWLVRFPSESLDRLTTAGILSTGLCLCQCQCQSVSQSVCLSVCLSVSLSPYLSLSDKGARQASGASSTWCTLKIE